MIYITIFIITIFIVVTIIKRVDSSDKQQNKTVDKLNHSIKELTEIKDINLKISFNEQMQINTISSIIEKSGKERNSSIEYMIDREMQNLIRVYFPTIFRIILGIDNNRITNEEAQKWHENKEFMSKKINELNILTSSLANQKLSFIDIRKSIEKFIYDTQIEISRKIEVNVITGSGNSKNIDIDYTLRNIHNVVEAEQYFNKGTEYFNKGNYYVALQYFDKAASLGDKDALYQLGNLHLEGKGTPQNLEKAYQNYIQSAELGHEKAQYNIGLFYLQGQFVSQDILEGTKWMEKSSQNGHLEATNVLNYIKGLKNE